jgi:hypothetical protein
MKRAIAASSAAFPIALFVVFVVVIAFGTMASPGAPEEPATAAPNSPGTPVAPAPLKTITFPVDPARRPRPEFTIVFCAPGYPGNTASAQPAMDAFSRAVETAAGWPAGKLGAVYHESEGGGVERLLKPDAVLAVTTLPFFLQDGDKIALKPRLAAQRNGSPSEHWSLIAQKGRVGAATDLDGWELTGPAGYAPDFVRTLLRSWGTIPSSTKITFSPAPLGALRRAIDGENLAVLMEPEQTQALFPKHPFAKDLDIVVGSKPVPGSVVCTVGNRLSEADAAKLLDALAHLHSSPLGAEALKTLRIEKFVTLPSKALDWLHQPATGRLTEKK